MSHERVHVGDVLELDRTPVSPEPERRYPRIGIRSFGKGIFHYEPQLGDELPTLRYYKIRAGCLVVSNIKGWEGAIAVSSKTDEQCLVSNRFLPYRPVDSDRLDVRWACWYFLSEPGNNLVQEASPGSADRNRTLAIGRFERLKIPLPPIDEQRRTADRLDRIAANISLLRKEVSRRATVRSALIGSLTSRPDLDGETKRRLGWERFKLAELLEISSDEARVEANGNYRIAGVYSFGRGLIDRGSILGSDTSYKVFTKVSTGDIVISKLNGWEGAVAVVGPDFDGFHVSSEYPTFKPLFDLLLPDFFSGIARSRWFWDALNQGVRGSMVRRRRISRAQFLNTEIWVPPLAMQERITRAISLVEQAEAARVSGRHEDLRVAALLPAVLNRLFERFS